jgi:hypothetical protein
MKTPNDHQRTRKWLLAVSALVLAIACFPVVNWAVPKLMRGDFSRSTGHRTSSAQEDGSAAPHKTKSSDRPAPALRATHGPQQWRDFFLPAQEIDNLTLAEALNQLRTAYEATCRETGEVPLQVTFKLPSQPSTRISLKLGRRTLESSVHLLAAVTKLTVRRHGREYRFTAAADSPGQHSTASLELPPNFQAKLFPAGGNQPMSVESLRAGLASMGLELNSSTLLTLDPNLKLTIETTSAADRAALASLVESAKLDPPLQTKLTARILEVAADVAWNIPDGTMLDDSQAQTFFRKMSQTKGVDLLTMPSVMAKPDQAADITIGREFITQVKGAENEFETHMVGLAINFNSSPLGLGHHVDMNFTDTTGNVDDVTGEATITERAAVQGNGFSGDSTTRLQVQTRPDGSRIVVLVTPMLIDSTGRPARAEQNP